MVQRSWPRTRQRVIHRQFLHYSQLWLYHWPCVRWRWRGARLRMPIQPVVRLLPKSCRHTDPTGSHLCPWEHTEFWRPRITTRRHTIGIGRSWEITLIKRSPPRSIIKHHRLLEQPDGGQNGFFLLRGTIQAPRQRVGRRSSRSGPQVVAVRGPRIL